MVTFAFTSSLNHMLRWCEESGYEVLWREEILTPEDEDFISTTILTVRKPRGRRLESPKGAG